jgi:hypothetical protein
MATLLVAARQEPRLEKIITNPSDKTNGHKVNNH